MAGDRNWAEEKGGEGQEEGEGRRGVGQQAVGEEGRGGMGGEER